MSDFAMNRRRFGLGVAAGLTLPMFARSAYAGGSVIVATFPNTWEDAYRRIVSPMLSAQGTNLVIAPSLTTAQIAKVLAAKSAGSPPPYDALLLSPGDIAVAIEKDLIVKIDPGKLKNWGKLGKPSQGEWGPSVTVEFCGIAYNPSLVPKPKGYKDLFENPAFAGKVSWTGFDSNTSIQAYSEIAKIYGNGPMDMDAVFKLFKEKAKTVGPIVDTTSHQMTMFQQGEIGAFMAATNNVAQLKSLGVPCEFASPETGCPAVPVIILMTKGATNPDAVYAYMDAAISTEAQSALELPPSEYVPTNTDVVLSPKLAAFITPEEVAKFVYLDWAEVAKHRAAWTKEFDRIVKS